MLLWKRLQPQLVSDARMVRRLLPILLLTFALHAQSRFLADAAGAPVKWEGWGTRAIERSKNEGRPIFLMIGYASSFECFHMQRTAYLDGEVAQTLNAYYVPTLLDRLEYPEIAESFETIARSANGLNGWPVLMILTPSLEPFAISGPLVTGDLSRMLVINANRWAHERDALMAEAHANVMKTRANLVPPPERPKYTAEFLKKIALSALHDQLGGGFHRAARDEAWRSPYFEKMLDDQALLAIAYLEEWQKTKDPDMERLARETLDAAWRDLHLAPRALDASQDAHSPVPAQGPEFWNGAFYMWDKFEISHLLGNDGALKVFRAYGLQSEKRNVLYVEDPVSLKDPAIVPLLAKLLDVRQKRPQPFRETNLISGLNGLMISAMARGGAVFNEKKYVDAALYAATIVTKNLWNAQKKTLLHSSGVEATADDYAMFVQGLLDLFEASYDPKWLDLAIALLPRQDRGGASSVPLMLQGLTVRHDEAITTRNHFRLALLAGQKVDGKIAAVTGNALRQATFDALHAIHEYPDPKRFVVFVPSKGINRDRMLKALPFTATLSFDPEHNNPITYECVGGECHRR